MLSVVACEEKLRRDLSRRIPCYHNPGGNTEVRFYWPEGESADSRFRVPRFYAQRVLGYPAGGSHVPPAGGEYRLRYPLKETPTRPQRTVFDATLKALRRHGGATIVLAPGSGKTVIALALAAELGQKTLVLCHKQFLIDQWRERIGQFATQPVKVGLLKQATAVTEGCTFVLASLQSLASRDYAVEHLRFGLVIIDETHHIPSRTFTKALGKLPAYRFSLGLTGTPKRSDGLGKMIFELVGAPSYQHSAPRNRRVQVTRVLYKPRQRTEIYLAGRGRQRRLNSAAMVTALTRDPTRLRLVLGIARMMLRKFPTRKGLLLSDRVDHLQSLYKYLGSERTALITGSINTEEKGGKPRKGRPPEFRKPLTLSTYGLFSEAVDFDGDFLILSTPKSNVEQAVGRILRGKNADVRPVVLDVCDDWSLFCGQAKRRRALYARRGYELCELPAAGVLAAAASRTYI
jgi:superfamily II DNA or RNA helicase